MSPANQPIRPLVSVLIPTYNYARYLAEAIESVLAQDYPNLEIILSDDASTDASAEIIRRYAARDPRIRARIHGQNLGMVANWNWCLSEARGVYVKYLFGDDRLATPQAVTQLVALLESNPRAVLAASARVLIDHDSQVTGLWNDLRTAGLRDGRRAILDCLFNNRNLIGEPSAVLFRRIPALRGFSPGLRQLVDMEMWFHLLLQGDLAYTPDPLCAFRRHGAQQTVVNSVNRTGDLEMVHIITRYLESRELRAQASLSEFAYRQILFRTSHYLRKAARREPQYLPIALQLESHLAPRWRAVCWLNHRLQRPFENLRRSIQKRLDQDAVTRQPALFNSLPAD
jgi:glycosyltransferase involved in cell wall biosynthesis